MVEIRSNRWTPREDDLFRRMAEANIRPELIAARLNRSVHAIKARAYAIGLPLKWFRPKARENERTKEGFSEPRIGQRHPPALGAAGHQGEATEAYPCRPE